MCAQDMSIVPGVRIEDMGHKMGCNGVDNGKLWFDGVHTSSACIPLLIIVLSHLSHLQFSCSALPTRMIPHFVVTHGIFRGAAFCVLSNLS